MTKKTYLLIGIIVVIIIVLIGIYISSQKTTPEVDENSSDANSIVLPENSENVIPASETPVENVVPTPETMPVPPVENVVPTPETNNVE